MRVELLHALVAERYAATFTRRRRLMLITGIVLTGGIVVGVVVVVVNAIIATFRATEFARRGDVLLLTLMTGLVKSRIQRRCCSCCYRAAAARKVLWRSSERPSHGCQRRVVRRRHCAMQSLCRFFVCVRASQESFLVVAVYVVVDVVLVLTAAIRYNLLLLCKRDRFLGLC